MKDRGQTVPLQSRDRFWQLLLEAGIVSQAAAEEMKQRIIVARPPLGKILCQERFVTVSQVMRLLEIQAEQSSLRIGELAVKHGYCSEVEVERALSIQRQSTCTPWNYCWKIRTLTKGSSGGQRSNTFASWKTTASDTKLDQLGQQTLKRPATFLSLSVV